MGAKFFKADGGKYCNGSGKLFLEIFAGNVFDLVPIHNE